MRRFGPDHGDSGGGAKRPFEKVQGDNVQGSPLGDKRQKLPALASVVVEAVKMDSLQKLCSSLEPILRKVVGEEVERALAKLVPSGILARTPPRQIQESPVSDLRLEFRTKISLPLFTGGKVEGEGGLPMHIVLKNGSTGQVFSSGPVSTAKLEVVVLDGDFANDDDEWTAEDFENHVVKERDGKRPLLTGELSATLKEGVGTLGDLSFTDNSSWIRSRKFRLGVRVAPGFGEGVRIQECKTDAFVVKDHRGELYKKHYPPHLHDEVWRLDKIGKDGAFHKKLQQNNIKTVEDFLRCYVIDQQKLRNALGSGMSNKMWEATVEHAKTCVLNGKLYVFCADRAQNIGVIFNNIYELMGVTFNNTYKSVESLTDSEKVHVDNLVKVAYENWSLVTEYKNESLASEATKKHLVMQSEREVSNAPKEQASLYSQSLTNTSFSASGAASQLYGYGAEALARYTDQDIQIIQSNQIFSPGTNLRTPNRSPQVGFPSSSEHALTGLALGPSQSSVSKPYGGYSNPPLSQHAFQGTSVEWQDFPVHNPTTPPVDYYFNEEDIRERTLEMLNNEDMQQLLRSSLSHPENIQLQGEDAYYSGFTPSPAMPYCEDGVRSSGKAYVGWLKLKAALRWGIFIRKIAAKKAIQRAQLEEIED